MKLLKEHYLLDFHYHYCPTCT